MRGESLANLLDTERRLLRRQRITVLNTSEIDYGDMNELVEDILIMSYENKEPIRVLITSPGGRIEPGLAGIRAIREAQDKGVKIIGEVFGQAESMAFFLLQSCDERIASKESVLMYHGFTDVSSGDLRKRRSQDKLLKDLQLYLAELCAEKNTSKEEDYHNLNFWLEILEDETPTYVNSQEALEMGLIDKVKGNA